MNAKQAKAILAIIEVVRDAVVEAGELGAPEGHLYAYLFMPLGIDLATFNRVVDLLVEAGQVTRGGHVLTATDAAKRLAKATGLVTSDA